MSLQRAVLKKSRKAQQGVVIVVALFMVALVATMAYVMMARLARDTERTSLIIRNINAEYYAEGSVLWAIDQLRNNWESQKPKQLVDVMPLTSPEMNVNGYRIQSTIEDMQGRFNLNNLSNSDAMVGFMRLLQTIAPNLDPKADMQLVEAIVSWITPGAPNSPYNQYYFAAPIPYRNPARKMQTVSELRMVNGITSGLYQALSPYVAALPEATLINVQTAPAVVLMTLSPTMTLDAAKAIVDYRKNNPMVAIESFANLDIVKNNNIPTDKVTVNSSYFLVKTDVKIENQRTLIYTLLERTVKDKKANVHILWQSKGAS